MPQVGPVSGGTTITVGGAYLANGTLTLGNALVPISFAGPTLLVGTTTAHTAGVVDAVLRNPSYGMATLSNAFSYQAAPDPNCPMTGGSITSVSPAYSLPVGGGLVTIAGVGISSRDIVTVSLGTKAAVIISQTRDAVVVTVPRVALPQTADIVTISNCDGVSRSYRMPRCGSFFRFWMCSAAHHV